MRQQIATCLLLPNLLLATSVSGAHFSLNPPTSAWMLLNRETCSYLPKSKHSRRHRRQWKDTIKPLLPCYLFIRIDIGNDNIASNRTTRGVSVLISFSDLPATVPDPLIDALLRLADPNTELIENKRVSEHTYCLY